MTFCSLDPEASPSQIGEAFRVQRPRSEIGEAFRVQRSCFNKGSMS